MKEIKDRMIKNFTIKKLIKDKCNNPDFWPENIPYKDRHLRKTKVYKNYTRYTNIKGKKQTIKFISELNIPLLPKKKQPVIGTTKFLLPYFLNDKFNVFALEQKKWNIQENNNLIHTIGELNEPIIRLVTIPKKLINNNRLSITSIELCILFNKYNYQLYEYKNNKEMLENIYFLIKNNRKIVINNDSLKLVNIKTKKIIYL
tara:strand:- start:315 stop:920 length:606 start_codon:yes stop_codon:yes gene_type:complete